MGWTRKELLLPSRLTPEERSDIVAAIKSGQSRNEIARTSGRSAGTISRIATQEGLSFDRSATKEATEAKAIENAAMLENLKRRFLEETQAALDELHSASTLHHWHSGEHLEHELTEPTFKDKRDIMWRAGGAVRNFLEIDNHQGGGDESFAAVDVWLDAMGGES